ncbi:hypothetical protein B7720_00970 [Streptococcus oralis subsp. oralis]|nr:hypothetical protein B7720_00970 [Streptococcus oralis subsp. oralis]
MLFLLCFYYTICQHFSLYHKIEKAVQEICDLEEFFFMTWPLPVSYTSCDRFLPRPRVPHGCHSR